jgi:predicted metal-binding membrane protein
MWAVMMVGMMLPSATPMVLAFATIGGQRTEAPFTRTALFVLGYVAVWTAYSAVATLAQWGLHAAALLSHARGATSPLLGGAFLLAAGAFQFTRLRDACMSQCRSPVGFLLTQWRPGPWGALIMGVRHGAYCVGCCWVLMSLSLVLGVMNLVWMAVLTAFMLVEKVAPANETVSRAAGLVLVGWGLWVAAGAIH